MSVFHSALLSITGKLLGALCDSVVNLQIGLDLNKPDDKALFDKSVKAYEKFIEGAAELGFTHREKKETA